MTVPPGDRSQFVALQPLLVTACSRCSSLPVTAGWLEVRFYRTSERRAKRELEGTLLLVALPSLIIQLAIAGWLLGHEATAPLRRLLTVMRLSAAGHAEVLADEGRPDEVGEVARGFDAVLSALHKSQLELEALHRRQLERADRFAQIGELATGLAHEIRNPLAGLSGALEILAEKAGGAAPPPEVIGEMRRQVDRLARTMDGLLGFARPRRARLQNTDVNACLENVLFLVRHLSLAQNVRLARELAPSLPPVRGDGGQVEQVLLNLCLNACQAMGMAGGELGVRTLARGREVMVEIRDSGPGIPPEARPHVFEPFFTTRSDGTGLGLSISERIVAGHGGCMKFICPPGGGTIFTVALPASGIFEGAA